MCVNIHRTVQVHSQNNCSEIIKWIKNRPNPVCCQTLLAFGEPSLCSYNGVAQIGPTGLALGYWWKEKQELMLFKCTKWMKYRWREWKQETSERHAEHGRADGESVKWRGRRLIQSQRTALSGAPAGNMCGNTQVDGNSSCCGEEECV